MRTTYPQPVSELAGTRRVIATATKVEYCHVSHYFCWTA